MHNANLSKTNLSLKIVIAHTRAVHQVIVPTIGFSQHWPVSVLLTSIGISAQESVFTDVS